MKTKLCIFALSISSLCNGAINVSVEFNAVASYLAYFGNNLNYNFTQIRNSTGNSSLLGFSGSNSYGPLNYQSSLNGARQELQNAGIDIDAGLYTDAATHLSAVASYLGYFGSNLNYNFTQIRNSTGNSSLLGFSGSNGYGPLNYHSSLNDARQELQNAATDIAAIPEIAFAPTIFGLTSIFLTVIKRRRPIAKKSA